MPACTLCASADGFSAIGVRPDAVAAFDKWFGAGAWARLQASDNAVGLCAACRSLPREALAKLARESLPAHLAAAEEAASDIVRLSRDYRHGRPIN